MVKNTISSPSSFNALNPVTVNEVLFFFFSLNSVCLGVENIEKGACVKVVARVALLRSPGGGLQQGEGVAHREGWEVLCTGGG